MSYKKIFLTRAKDKHGSLYGYQELPDTFTYKDWVPIICHKHGRFRQKARTHAAGSGCSLCAKEIREVTQYSRYRHTLEQFVEKARKAHGDYYDYSQTQYNGQMKRVQIVCPTHGPFTVIANNHVHGTGCAKCKRSRGETTIANILNRWGIPFETQKAFPDLFLPNCKKRTNKPKYDFYLPEHNLLIEYDGKHHFEPVQFNGVSKKRARELFERTKLSDHIKEQYASDNNIRLIRISHKEFADIESILDGLRVLE